MGLFRFRAKFSVTFSVFQSFASKSPSPSHLLPLRVCSHLWPTALFPPFPGNWQPMAPTHSARFGCNRTLSAGSRWSCSFLGTLYPKSVGLYSNKTEMSFDCFTSRTIHTWVPFFDTKFQPKKKTKKFKKHSFGIFSTIFRINTFELYTLEEKCTMFWEFSNFILFGSFKNS